MPVNALDKIIDGLREALVAEINAAYERGKADAKAEILALLSADSARTQLVSQDVDNPLVHAKNSVEIDSESDSPDHVRKRAPRGLPRALAERVLGDYDGLGCTPADILDEAETDYEKMIKLSSVRSELRKGEKEGRYVESGGVWHLLKNDEVNEMLV